MSLIQFQSHQLVSPGLVTPAPACAIPSRAATAWPTAAKGSSSAVHRGKALRVSEESDGSSRLSLHSAPDTR